MNFTRSIVRIRSKSFASRLLFPCIKQFLSAHREVERKMLALISSTSQVKQGVAVIVDEAKKDM
jgi:hypothetical protein